MEAQAIGSRLMPWFRTRRSMLLAILAVQAAVMSAGLVLTFVQVRHITAKALQRVVLDTNVGFAERFAHELERVSDDTLEYGSEAWQRVQDRVEALELPGGGYVCLLDADGYVLCHPEMRRSPTLRRTNLFDRRVTLADGDSLRLGGAPHAETLAGRMSVPFDGTHYVATRQVPGLGARLIVHQPESGMVSLLSAATVPIVLGGALRIGFVLALTAACSVLIIRRYECRLEGVNKGLEDEIEHRTAHGLATRNALIFGLAKLADYRDYDTGLHLERIQSYSRVLAERLRGRCPEIDDAWIENLEIASSMHDIGKVGLPDEILLKPGRFTPAERKVMETHPVIGADTLIAVRRRMGDDDLLNMSIQVALQHHERWDGAGYPLGLAGEDIALAARIVALADFYDAVTAKRVYKDAMSHEECTRLIVEGRGRHFDPMVVDAFLASVDAFKEIRRAMNPHPDESEGRPAIRRAA